MKFECVDLAEAGVVLRPARTGDPIAAVLENRSEKPIAAWSLRWKFEESSGREYSSSHVSGVGGVPTLLLPFGLQDEQRAVQMYWNTILPGSRRTTNGGNLEGDNSDVRAPHDEEQWRGGGVGAAGGSPVPSFEKMKRVVLVLDGIFFADGEFAGPNEGQLWEHIVYTALAYRDIANVAAEKRASGLDAASVLRAIEEITGRWTPDQHLPPMAPGRNGIDEFRKQAWFSLAGYIAHMRQQRGDEATVEVLVGWVGTELPAYRRGTN